ncbi:hypothetical protein F4X86_04740 [Candidatus Saccharibacteria bacterium]|nr:hypothetical protein [Candidatus Saccharibacteria bacterium]
MRRSLPRNELEIRALGVRSAEVLTKVAQGDEIKESDSDILDDCERYLTTAREELRNPGSQSSLSFAGLDLAISIISSKETSATLYSESLDEYIQKVGPYVSFVVNGKIR